jgi:DNA polymerase-3 subunit gamma/tau
MTGQPWVVNLATEGGDPTLAQQKKTDHDAKVKISREHPLVQSLMESFPGATLTAK